MRERLAANAALPRPRPRADPLLARSRATRVQSPCAGGDGNDVLVVKGFNYTLFGGAGNDVLTAEGSDNVLLVCAPCPPSPSPPTLFSSAGSGGRRHAERDRRRQRPLGLPRVLPPAALDLSFFRRVRRTTTR